MENEMQVRGLVLLANVVCVMFLPCCQCVCVCVCVCVFVCMRVCVYVHGWVFMCPPQKKKKKREKKI